MGQISFLGHVETSPLFVIHLFEICVQMYGPQWRTGAACSGDRQQSERAWRSHFGFTSFYGGDLIMHRIATY